MDTAQKTIKNKGQALILIIIVMFIVFFLVVSVSENLSNDTLNTSLNQASQKAFTAASTALSGAEDYLNKNPGAGNYQSGVLSYDNGQYSYAYTVTPQNDIDQIVSADQAVQADVSSSSTATITWNNSNAILVLNIILKNQQAWGADQINSYQCVYFPASLPSKLSSSDVDFSNFSQPSICPAGSQSLAPDGSGVYHTPTFNFGAYPANYVRATVVDYTPSDSTELIITPNPTSTQQYKIVATGSVGQTRHVITTYRSVYGAPPGIFDYVLFNGGNGSSITF